MNAQLKPIVASAGFDPLTAVLVKQRAAHQRAGARSYPPADRRPRTPARPLKARLEDFVAAMTADFGRRSRHESLLTDGMTVLPEIDHVGSACAAGCAASRGLADWLFWPATTQVRYQPLGVVGIIVAVELPGEPRADAAGGGDRLPATT